MKGSRELDPDGPRLVVPARVRLEGQPVEAGGMVERQLARGLVGRALGERGAALALPAPEQMDGERLEVDGGRGLEHAGEVPVMGSQVAGRELLDDGLPDAVVTGLDDLVAFAEPDADEAFAAKQLDVVVRRASLSTRGREDGYGEGPSRDRHRLRKTARARGKPVEPIAHDIRKRPERERRADRRRLHPVASYELLDEKGAAMGFARDGARRSLGQLVGGTDPGERERLGLLDLEGADADVADVGGDGPALVHLEQEGARGGLLLSIRQEEQDRRRVRGPHHLVEQRDAVDVAPLHVVDVEDERPASRERAHELAQRTERALPHAMSVAHRQVGEGREARDALDHGKQLGERGGVPRHPERPLDLLDADEEPGERVHQAVHGLVRDRLALVGAAAEHLRFATRLEVVEEALDEGGLAHARAAAHAHCHRLVAGHGLEGRAERADLLVAAHEYAVTGLARRTLAVD